MGEEKQKLCPLLASLFVLAFLLCGCSGGKSVLSSAPDCRVVTGISVQFESGPIRFQRTYNASEKMQQILNYLRVIDPYGPPEEDPETAAGSSFRIELSYSDGCSKTYLQKGDRFMKEEGQAWKRIDPKRARELSQILGQMEGDLPGSQ